MFLLAFHFNILKQTSATMFFYMCESKAAATNVFARKRSVSGKCLLRENEVSAANVYCAKTKCQRQMFTARKRSVSGKCLLRENEVSAANVYCAKTKCQRQQIYNRVTVISFFRSIMVNSPSSYLLHN